MARVGCPRDAGAPDKPRRFIQTALTGEGFEFYATKQQLRYATDADGNRHYPANESGWPLAVLPGGKMLLKMSPGIAVKQWKHLKDKRQQQRGDIKWQDYALAQRVIDEGVMTEEKNKKGETRMVYAAVIGGRLFKVVTDARGFLVSFYAKRRPAA